MKNSNFKKLYSKNFFKIPKEYFHYKKIGIHIVDKVGIQRYLSWTHKDLGKNILKDRKDLTYLFKKPRPYMGISVGKFSITFKGIIPIYDNSHKFLGIVEAIAHFDSISKKLCRDGIDSAIIINKSFTPQLKYPDSKIFIEGCNIANPHLKPNLKKLLEKYGINYFTNIKTYKFIPETGSLTSGYYVVSIPILSSKKELIGHYIAFIYDKFKLAQKETIMQFMIILMMVLFLIMTYLVYKEHLKNIKLITNLDKEIKNQINEKLKLLYMDSTTGAYKKLKFEEDINDYTDSSVVMLNIKNFSKINEAYGFDIGDKILKVSVKRIENLLSRKIYRINADEFLFFSYKIRDEIKSIKNKFIKEPIKITKENINLRISFSFGVINSSEDKLISKLSTSVKKAKKYPFYDFIHYRKKETNNNFIKYNSLLYDAVFSEKQAKIIPYYQGIMDNKTGKITKYEALARLVYKDKVYSPFFFIEIAKDSGFLYEITKIMIEKSCKYLSSQDKNIEISINITEDDLTTNKLKKYLLNVIKKYDISAKRITLEILEGITAVGTKNNIKQLKNLKDLGFKLAIDDFGIEYSNFERINELELDFIKIDGKYIKSIHINQKSYKITKAITDFAHSLDIKVVAEFVENKEIQNIVKTLGMEYSQGYYFSEPQEKILKPKTIQ